jgi:two-component system, LuxR family, response regulator FixJ
MSAELWIVDDDPAITSSLSALLTAEGYQTRAFNSPKAFLDFIHPEARGCLISDIRMPEMSGLDLQLRLLEMGMSFPVIFITAHGDLAMAIRALRAGAVDFIEKPFPNALLLDSLKRALGPVTILADRTRIAGIEARYRLLTERERQVMALVVQGLSSKEVAQRLAVSPRTIDIHRNHMMAKMKAGSLAELVRQSILLDSGGAES